MGYHPSNRISTTTVAFRALLVTVAFQGVSGVAGGVGLVADPSGSGVGIPLEWLSGSPFSDYLVPGVVLLTALGIVPLVVAYGLWSGRPWAFPASLLVGVVLLMWLGVEIVVIGYQTDPPLQLIYGVVGAAIVALALRPSVRVTRPHRDDEPGGTAAHLAWIPAGAAVGFLASFVFGDRLALRVDLYYLIYFTIILGFFAAYAKATGLDLRARLLRRWPWAVGLGVVGGLALLAGVLARPSTPALSGGALLWAIAYRGVIYGAVDGVLLFAFPWLVVWRALGAEGGAWGTRLRAGALAFASMLLITTTYHLGYGDFRSSKIVMPNVGTAIGGLPTLLAANPAASVVSHMVMHVTAVVHSPDSELYLPPHGRR